MKHFPILLSPGKIGSLSIRNRIVMPPIATNYASLSGEATKQLTCYLEKRGWGGVGLIIVEGAYVSKEGKGFARSLGIDEDRFIPKLREMVKRIKATGASIALQLIHSGRQTKTDITNLPTVAPSAIACPVVQQTPVPLTHLEIGRIESDFARAACRAKEAGFDAVEVQGAHGYLIHQFLSPVSNQRDDDYGGSAQNRVRFAQEILMKIRESVGKAFPVILRIDAEEYVEGGIDLQLSSFYCEKLSPFVDAVHVSAGSYASREWIVQSYFNEPGLLAPLAGCIRKKIEKPVIAVGRIHKPQLAEEILQRGDADFIAMGRALLADAELPQKAQIGEPETIVPCLSCYQGCSDRLRANLDISCFVNPMVGKECIEMTSLKGKTYCLVIGGGPAGVSAAFTLSQRGAQVTIVERRERLGGQLLWAAKVNYKRSLEEAIQFYQERLKQGGVKLIRREATAEWIAQQKADFVILATGSVPFIPPIPGLAFIKSYDFGTAIDGGVLEKNVAVVGGGATGCDTAEIMMNQGKSVVIIEMLDQLAGDLGNIRPLFVERLNKIGLKIYTSTQIREIQENQILLQTKSDVWSLKGIEGVVIACGVTPNNSLEKQLHESGIATVSIGDCRQVKNGFWAMQAGFELGMSLGAVKEIVENTSLKIN